VGLVKIDTNENGRFANWIVVVGLALLAGCAFLGWFFNGQNGDVLTIEQAQHVLADRGAPLVYRRRAASRIDAIGSIVLDALKDASHDPDGKVASDARIYLNHIKRALEGQ